MFERYTEKARRVIFFARFEASQYGSPYIETEHLLLGLFREDRTLVGRFFAQSNADSDIRIEIEGLITRRERISTSVEMPLTDECRKTLTIAAAEADNLGHRYVGTEHLLLGLLGVAGSLACRLLRDRGLQPEAIREELSKASPKISPEPPSVLRKKAIDALNSFLAGLKVSNWEHLAHFFALNAHFVGVTGSRWVGRDEIEKQFEVLLAPYAKKNGTFVLEDILPGPSGSMLASILWENMTVAGETERRKHRMTLLLASDADGWVIHLLQATPVLA